MQSIIAIKFRNWINSDRKFKKVLVSLDYYLRRRRAWSAFTELSTKDKFTEIYRHNLWNNEESRSGGGSTMRRTENIRTQLPRLVHEYGVTSILDAGCGDFNWMKSVRAELPVRYLGVDVVREMIDENQQRYANSTTSFMELDITTADIPSADLVISREVLFHLTDTEIFAALKRLKASGSKYLLTTHYPQQASNVDITTGSCRPINFERPPFNFPVPRECVQENTPGQCVALWSIADL